jgi:hypothetical protein
MYSTFEQIFNKTFCDESPVFLSHDMDHTENDTSNNSCASVFVAAFLPSRCLATIGGYAYILTDWEEFMKYAVEMGSDTMIFIPSFIKIGSSIQKLIGGGGDSMVIQ